MSLVDDGIFAVPELQREFVWTSRKACDLLDSLYRNYPIGTLLVWKTGRRNENQLRSQLHILPPFNPSNSHIWFLIDGQQRLSVLWHFVSGAASAVKNADGREVDFGAVHLDTHARGADRPFVYRKRVVGTLSRRLVPVVDILARNWKHKTNHYGRRARKRIADCRYYLLSYKVLFVFCETDDRTEVRETFIRVNSLGMRIGAADRAFARASKIKMRNLVRDVQARLKNGFGRVKRTTILQTMALALGSRDLGERAIDAMVSRLEGRENERLKFNRTWARLRDAFTAAADYLVHSLEVPGFDFLPSEPMFTVLTLYFFHKGAGRPSKAAQKRLRRWFWSTAIGARNTGSGYRPNWLADTEFAERLARNSNAQLTKMPRVPAHALRSIDYSRPGPLATHSSVSCEAIVPGISRTAARFRSVRSRADATGATNTTSFRGRYCGAMDSSLTEPTPFSISVTWWQGRIRALASRPRANISRNCPGVFGSARKRFGATSFRPRRTQASGIAARSADSRCSERNARRS